MKKCQIQGAGFYLAGLLCLVLAVAKLALDMPWSWWRVLLPTWVVLWQSAVYVGVGFIWMTGKGWGRATGDVKTRRRHGLDRYQLWSMLFAPLFIDKVLRRVGGPGESAWWWLASGRLDALLLTGGSMLACQFLFWSGSVQTGKPRGLREPCMSPVSGGQFACSTEHFDHTASLLDSTAPKPAYPHGQNLAAGEKR